MAIIAIAQRSTAAVRMRHHDMAIAMMSPK